MSAAMSGCPDTAASLDAAPHRTYARGMPELPEVEEVRRTLEPRVLGITVVGTSILRRDFLHPSAAPLRHLVGRRITATHRHGKKIFLFADDSQSLVLHLGMTGRVDCVPTVSPIAAHSHIILSLASGVDVRLRDPRRFGGLWYYPTRAQALGEQAAGLGPDALALHPGHLAHWAGRRGRLKSRLLLQRDVAGLGNIYVDEALWAARIHPLQRVDRLSGDQLRTLVRAIRAVLRRSLASGGTTLRDYRNVSNQPGNFARKLKVYGRGGLPCRRCGELLTRDTIAGRTTVYCGRCQKRR